MKNKITEEIIETELGWTKASDGNYTKTPYPFILKYNSDTKDFTVQDLFFPEVVQYNFETKLETIQEYDNLVIPILRITQNASNDDIFNYKVNCLKSSYAAAIRAELTKITNLHLTIRENHINTFIKYSFGNEDPIFKITNLDFFLNLVEPDGSLAYFKGRYKEQKAIFDRVEQIIFQTKEHLVDIYSKAVPN